MRAAWTRRGAFAVLVLVAAGVFFWQARHELLPELYRDDVEAYESGLLAGRTQAGVDRRRGQPAAADERVRDYCRRAAASADSDPESWDGRLPVEDFVRGCVRGYAEVYAPS